MQLRGRLQSKCVSFCFARCSSTSFQNQISSRIQEILQFPGHALSSSTYAVHATISATRATIHRGLIQPGSGSAIRAFFREECAETQG